MPVNRFVIHNTWSGPVALNIEPEGVIVRLPAGEVVTVIDRFAAEPVAVKLSRSQAGEPIFSIWPGDGDVRIEKDGVDVLDISAPEHAHQ